MNMSNSDLFLVNRKTRDRSVAAMICARGGGAGAGGRAEYPDVLLLRNIGTDRKEVRHL